MQEEETPPMAPAEVPEEAPEDYKDKFVRIVAEMENLRKRVQKEKEEASRFALQNFAKEILRVADHLRLALQNVGESETMKSFVTGVEMTHHELHSILQKYGIEKVPSDFFDAHFHQAISEDTESDAPAGTITQILQEGYTLHSRLLRPALVIVKK